MVNVDRLRAQLRRARPVGLLVVGGVIGALLVIAFGPVASSSTPPAAGSTPGATASSSPGMGGMNMGTSATSAANEANSAGVKPVPMQQLGVADWQGMKITADAMTPVPFLIYNGTSMQEIKPAKNTSFHLMVLLNDAQTGVVIPYASVWATVTKGSAIPVDERLWPMISRYMGPHYGDDVSLPGAGTYKLTLLISPPVSARHVEYQDVWLKPHQVTFTFHWAATSGS
ncbi:MAG TPA: iron transporter [Trebonia sp.]|nr:iron transporter [Trebonia sp.]